MCHTFQYDFTNFESSDILSVSNTTKDILSVSNTYTNGTTLLVSKLEQGGTEILVDDIILFDDGS